MVTLAVWLRSAVAHWLQMDILHDNECVLTLIGAQGCGNTTTYSRVEPRLYGKKNESGGCMIIARLGVGEDLVSSPPSS